MRVPQAIVFVLAALMLVTSLAEAQGRCGGGQDRGACLAAMPVEDLSAAEKESLLLMRQEEKLARDVYLTLGEKYDLPVFTNIPRAEQRHMDQLATLLERYGLEDPVAGLERGKFASSEMQSLYSKLVAQGSKSLVAALQAGAAIEDMDIHDLEQALAGGVDNQDITQVYSNLARGSRNHMRAFHAQLKAHEATYKAQHISQAELEAIVSSDWERGSGRGQGAGRKGSRGQGQGHGRGQGRGYRGGQGGGA